VEQVSVRELKQDTFGILARVEAGETLEITNHGKPVARVVPVRLNNEMDDPIAAGRVTPATVFRLSTAPTGEVENDAASD
jgi:prevent-host-death family protein